MEATSILPQIIDNNHISVQTGAACNGYSPPQYLRRLLRTGKLSGVKVGQVCLTDKAVFDDNLDTTDETSDRRFSPPKFLPTIVYICIHLINNSPKAFIEPAIKTTKQGLNTYEGNLIRTSACHIPKAQG
jgi:hypothetical protein